MLDLGTYSLGLVIVGMLAHSRHDRNRNLLRYLLKLARISPVTGIHTSNQDLVIAALQQFLSGDMVPCH
jgi:hypothetical protein